MKGKHKMRLRTLSAFALALLLSIHRVIAQAASDPNEGSVLNRDSSTGVYSFSWWGRSGRTYFLQQTGSVQTGIDCLIWRL